MPARSQAQQRFMGMVHAEKEGTLDKSKLDPEFAKKIEEVAAKIKAKQARDLAKTKHKNLPEKVKTAASWTSPIEGKSNDWIREHSNKPLKGGIRPNKKENYWYRDIKLPPEELPKKVKKKKLLGKKRVKWEGKYDLEKTAKKELVYPRPVKQTPSPHLFWKPLMRKIFPDWGDDAVRTKGLGAQIERIVPFGKSGRHWPAANNEVVSKVPGTKGWIQRALPGGKSGFQLEKNSGIMDDAKEKFDDTSATIKDWYHWATKQKKYNPAYIKAEEARKKRDDVSSTPPIYTPNYDHKLRRDIENRVIFRGKPFNTPTIEKRGSKGAYLKWLARALKASKKPTVDLSKKVFVNPATKLKPISAPTPPKPKAHINPKGFSVTKLGGGHYDAWLGPNKIGSMTINPSTKLVDDVKILKDYRSKGFGTRLYEGALGHEGMLVRNPETVSPGALRIWEKLSLKYPPSPGSGGVLWRQPAKNIMKQGSLNKTAGESKWKDTAKVGLMGTSSIVIPFVPLHSVAAAKTAPKDQGGAAVAGATVGGYVGHIPSLAYAGYKVNKALKKKDKAVAPLSRQIPAKAQSKQSRFERKFEKKYNKRYAKSTAGKVSKIWRKLKTNLSAGDIKKMMALQVVGQGVGAGIGYARSTDYSKKTKKSK